MPYSPTVLWGVYGVSRLLVIGFGLCLCFVAMLLVFCGVAAPAPVCVSLGGLDAPCCICPAVAVNNGSLFRLELELVWARWPTVNTPVTLCCSLRCGGVFLSVGEWHFCSNIPTMRRPCARLVNEVFRLRERCIVMLLDGLGCRTLLFVPVNLTLKPAFRSSCLNTTSWG